MGAVELCESDSARLDGGAKGGGKEVGSECVRRGKACGRRQDESPD